MKIGFTGTREGMTDVQKSGFIHILGLLRPREFHHGDCIGADAQAADIADRMGIAVCIHPPIDETHRAFTKFGKAVSVPKTMFARNRDIVDECDKLIAAPLKQEPITKTTMGGTAYTVTYARKRLKSLVIVWPDGGTSWENPQPDGI